jgi:hypothetical protein
MMSNICNSLFCLICCRLINTVGPLQRARLGKVECFRADAGQADEVCGELGKVAIFAALGQTEHVGQQAGSIAQRLMKVVGEAKWRDNFGDWLADKRGHQGHDARHEGLIGEGAIVWMQGFSQQFH